MTAAIISLSEWKKRKMETLESMVPKRCGSLDDFLGYCLYLGEAPAFFKKEYANALYKMVGLSYDKNRIVNFDRVYISQPEMRNIVDIIKRKRNLIEIKSPEAG